MMNRKFILVGLLLTVFVFPLILDVDAAFAQVFGVSMCQKDLEKAQK